MPGQMNSGYFMAVSVAATLIYSGCSDFLEEQITPSGPDASVSALDDTACLILNNPFAYDTTVTDTTIGDTTISDTTILVESIFIILESPNTANIDSLWSSADPSALDTLVAALKLDSLLVIDNLSAGDSAYAILEADLGGSDRGFVLYSDDFWNVSLIGVDGTVVEPASAAIPLEALVGCPQIVLRQSYMLESKRYLFKIDRAESTLSDYYSGNVDEAFHIVLMRSP